MSVLIPGTNVPSSTSGSGTIKRDSGLFSGHLFNVGIEKPQILSALIITHPQFYLTTITDKLTKGSLPELHNQVLTWPKLGRTRKSSTASSIANGTTATATITTDIAYSAANDNSGYWLVGDTIYITNSGARGRVTAVGNSGGFQTIDVVRAEGGNWSTALLNTGFKFGHTGTSFGQGSSGSGGYRSYLPTSDWNVTSTLRRGIKVTRNAMKDKTYIDDTTWIYQQEDIEHKEMLRDIEATTVFGTRFKATTLTSPNQSRGLWEYAEGSGKTETFSSATGCQEENLTSLITQLLPEQGSSDLVVLCGEQILADINRNLSTNYRSIPNSDQPAEIAGLNFQSYQFLGKKLHLAYYEMFSDDAVVPQVTATSTAKDFRNAAMVLDFGAVPKYGNNININYYQPLIQKAITGMGSESFEISNGFDGVQFEMLTEFMPCCFLPNRLGLLYSNS